MAPVVEAGGKAVAVAEDAKLFGRRRRSGHADRDRLSLLVKEDEESDEGAANDGGGDY